MRTDWDHLYSGDRYRYGKEPNLFFKQCIEELPVGRILLPAEGEGRNAVYAASLGWHVVAFDESDMARGKALSLALERGVPYGQAVNLGNEADSGPLPDGNAVVNGSLSYQVCNFPDFVCRPNSFDSIAFIYAHLPEDRKMVYYRHLFPCLKLGGKVIFEAFGKKQRTYQKVNPQAGGPRELGMLFSVEELKGLFEGFEIVLLEEKDIRLSEGHGHNGMASVIRCVAVKN